MEIIRYDAPFEYADVFDVWKDIFGVDEAKLEELQINGSESQYNHDFVYVAKEGDKILGIIHTTIPVDYPTFCGISGVCTTPEARGKGVGRTLYAKMTEDMDNMGVKTAFLGTGNMIAAKLYGNSGFSFYPGTSIMYRQKDGAIFDFKNETYANKPEKITVSEGNQSFRIPVIPLILNSTGGVIGDINTNIAINTFVQNFCMSLYPRYLKLKENGGHYFGAKSETNLLGGIASVMKTEIGNRCDFFWNDNFAEAVPEMIEKCREKVGEIYFQIADLSAKKIRFAEDLGYVPCESVDFAFEGCVIPTKIYRKK